jgi:signal transduction histidine kinase
MLGSTAHIQTDPAERSPAQTRLVEAAGVASQPQPGIGDGSAYFVHEISQPLNAIMLNAETALRWLTRDPPHLHEVREAVERIVGNGQRASHLVHGARDLARTDSNRMTHVDIHAVINQILELMKADLSRHQVAVEIAFSDSPAIVLGNFAQLQQVVSNLATNAIEAMSLVEDRKRTLRIGTQLDQQGCVTVSIEDSGAGIDPGKIDQIFDPFFTTKGTGMGLGLSICCSIVEELGGRLSANPKLPHGSVFSFTIPGCCCELP